MSRGKVFLSMEGHVTPYLITIILNRQGQFYKRTITRPCIYHNIIKTIARQIKSIYDQNTSLCEASTKIGIDVHYGQLFEKSPLATSIFKMAAIF